MPFLLGTKEYTKEWLTDDEWIVLNVESIEFVTYLENTYFTPNTRKNADFEVAILPLKFYGSSARGITFWFRIKDTPLNRENLRRAIEDFECRTLRQDWEKVLHEIKLIIKTDVDGWLR